MKVRIFTDQNTSKLQLDINKWLAANLGISVTQILQSESLAKDGQSWVTISIFYIGTEA
jgi:hypothetical protein